MATTYEERHAAWLAKTDRQLALLAAKWFGPDDPRPALAPAPKAAK